MCTTEIERELIKLDRFIEKALPDNADAIRKQLDDMDTSKLDNKQTQKYQGLWQKFYSRFPEQQNVTVGLEAKEYQMTH
jgi:hypothetical protein